MAEEIINRIEKSGLIQLDLEKYLPLNSDVELLDISQFLFQGIILKEKDFRAQLKDFDFSFYKNKNVCVIPLNNVIIPQWAILLITVYLYNNNASFVYCGEKEQFFQESLLNNLNKINLDLFTDKKVIVKGCSNSVISINAYLHLLSLIQPVVKSIMYGEPCSTVPLYKK
jgi:hypothetical protein